MAQHGPDARQIPFRASVDYAGREAQNALFGERLATRRNPNLSSHFYWGINPLEIATAVTGNGVADASNSLLRVGVSASGASTSSATSIDRVYYRTGHDGYALFTAAWDATAVNMGASGRLNAGIYDDQTGYAISYNASGLSIMHRLSGSDTFTPQVDFTLDKLDGTGNSKFKLKPETVNIFRISYGYLGIAPAIFEVYGGFEKGWIPFHVIDLTNSVLATVVNFPFLPIRFEATGTFAGSAYLRSGSWSGGTISETREHKDYQHFAAESDKTGITTTLTNLVTIRPKATFRGVTNHIPITIELISAATRVTVGQAIGKISVWRNANVGGTPAWNDVDTNSSVEYDVAGTTVTGGAFLGSFLLTEGDSKLLRQKHGQMGARPGEALTFAAQTTTNNADISLSARWQELL